MSTICIVFDKQWTNRLSTSVSTECGIFDISLSTECGIFDISLSTECGIFI